MSRTAPSARSSSSFLAAHPDLRRAQPGESATEQGLRYSAVTELSTERSTEGWGRGTQRCLPPKGRWQHRRRCSTCRPSGTRLPPSSASRRQGASLSLFSSKYQSILMSFASTCAQLSALWNRLGLTLRIRTC